MFVVYKAVHKENKWGPGTIMVIDEEFNTLEEAQEYADGKNTGLKYFESLALDFPENERSQFAKVFCNDSRYCEFRKWFVWPFPHEDCFKGVRFQR